MLDPPWGRAVRKAGAQRAEQTPRSRAADDQRRTRPRLPSDEPEVGGTKRRTRRYQIAEGLWIAAAVRMGRLGTAAERPLDIG